eukprot:UN01810
MDKHQSQVASLTERIPQHEYISMMDNKSQAVENAATEGAYHSPTNLLEKAKLGMMADDSLLPQEVDPEGHYASTVGLEKAQRASRKKEKARLQTPGSSERTSSRKNYNNRESTNYPPRSKTF